MWKNWLYYASLCLLVAALPACASQAGAPSEAQSEVLSEAQAADMAWAALEPNTSSHNRDNWEVVEVRSVKGSEIRAEFSGQNESAGCWMGPTPEPNRMIRGASTYWYVVMKPKPATPLPQATENYSPTAPPAIPEPFMVEAYLLLDPATGEVVARKLLCVIY
jgi:hypothetical protein